MSATEKHYLIPEIAKLWHLSADCVREIFRDVAGVIRINRPRTRNKRGYESLRIPESVMLRMHQRITRTA